MRGKVTATPANAGATGITPAYAGKSHCHPGQCGRNGDHPRVCGEKLLHSLTRKKARDHPRVCGEKCRKCAPLISIQGSPPRMRGKGVKRCLVWAIPRITPAYAGKRDGVERVRNCAEDHPRVCGEKNRRRAGMVCDMGSPPRMRGKEYQRTTLFLFGITPAYAGKRFAHGVSVGARGSPPRMRGKASIIRADNDQEDHPRVCGEKGIYGESHRGAGITPAYAGKSVIMSCSSSSAGSPPRMRGKVDTRSADLRQTGSPPRMRGKGITQRTGLSSS